MTLTIGTSSVALRSAWWARATTVAERTGAERRRGPEPAQQVDDRQRRRLERWQTAHGLQVESFQRRLSDAGLTTAELLDLLCEDADAIAGRLDRPAWAAQLEAALPAHATEPAPGDDAVSGLSGMAAIVAPFVRQALRRLAAAGTGDHVDASALTGELAERLVRTLVQLAARTLVLELNVLRVTDRLAGDTPQERFASFVRHYCQPVHLVGLFDEYPVLGRLLAQAVERAVDGHLELLDRYARDRATLVTGFFGGIDPGPLVSVGSTGDGHRGRAVAVLRFAHGAKVVYKPRPLAVHRHFNDVVAWLNRLMPGLDLRRLRVIDGDGYGWLEFASFKPCRNAAAVSRYYRRQGALLALLYALDGADFHFENLIACGDQPVLIDLEALLHPQVRIAAPEWLASDPAMLTLGASVDRVGLLPRMTIGADGAIDLSGLGGDKGATLPKKQAAFVEVGTDAMTLTRAPAQLSGGQNRPSVAGTDADPAQYAGELLAGFTDAYDAIAAHRSDLIGEDGLLWRFADDEIRVILRGTQMYAQLLDESTHPDVMRDALDRDRIFDYLWAASAGDPVRERLFRYEVADLWAGDVPIFTTRPTATDVWTSTGTPVSGVLTGASIEHAANKIRELSPADRDRQIWIIQAAFASRPNAGIEQPVAGSGTRADEPGSAEPDRLVAAARAVAAEIERRACSDERRVNWLGLDLVDSRHWALAPLGFDLFGGYPGVALFLAQLAAVTGEERYAAFARHAMSPVPDVVRSLTGERVGFGGFNGAAGLAYSLVHLAALLDDPTIADPVEAIVAACRAGAEADGVPDPFDLVGGSAGTLAAMLAVHEATGLESARELAGFCAQRLVDHAHHAGGGLAWPGPVDGRYLAGFSHGSGGIGWALIRYAAATRQIRYARLAGSAFRHERTLYDADLGDWLDLRQEPPGAGRPPTRMHAWCNGAPGIGLARADALRRSTAAGLQLDAGLRLDLVQDLDLAVASTVTTGRLPNHSLCHGELGNLELLTAAAALGVEEAAEHRSRRVAAALVEIERGAARCGTPGNVGTPGLLTGYAGIGHGLLRLAFPDRVPAVLLLDPPTRSGE